MKALILYATKYGAAEKIAKRIAKKLNRAVLCDLKQNDIPALSGFDTVIIGSSLYAGMIRKEAKVFLSKNANVLQGKKIGLFLSGMDIDKDKGKTYFETNFPPELLQSAKAKILPGGIYDPKKAGFMERFIFKLATKKSEYSDIINEDEIVRLVKELTE